MFTPRNSRPRILPYGAKLDRIRIFATIDVDLRHYSHLRADIGSSRPARHGGTIPAAAAKMTNTDHSG